MSNLTHPNDVPQQPSETLDTVLGQLYDNGTFYDVDLDTHKDPRQEYIAEAKTKVEAIIDTAVAEAELYGRLHETIEAFQEGRISAAHYSSRHNELTEDLSALRTTGNGQAGQKEKA